MTPPILKALKMLQKNVSLNLIRPLSLASATVAVLVVVLVAAAAAAVAPIISVNRSKYLHAGYDINFSGYGKWKMESIVWIRISQICQLNTGARICAWQWPRLAMSLGAA